MLGTLHDRSVHVTIMRGSHWPALTGRLVGLCLRATLGRRMGGGTLPPSGTAGRLLLVDVTDTTVLSVEGPRSVPSRISMVLVDGTMAGDTPGWECPHEDEYWLVRRGRPVCLLVVAMLDCRVLGKRCPP